MKPTVKLVGTDGNIFALMGTASRALRKAGQTEQAKKMQQRIQEAHSYDDALSIILDYVEAT